MPLLEIKHFNCGLLLVSNLISDLHIEWGCHVNDHRHTHCEHYGHHELDYAIKLMT